MSTKLSNKNKIKKPKVVLTIATALENASRITLPDGYTFEDYDVARMEFEQRFRNKKQYKQWMKSQQGLLEILKDPWKAKYMENTKWYIW